MHIPTAVRSGSFIVLMGLVGLAGCMPAAQQPGGAGGGGAPGAAGADPSTVNSGATDGRKRDMVKVKEAVGQLNKAVDQTEAQIKHAFDVALGKADAMKTKKTASAAELVTFLRGKKMPLRLGKGVHSRREKFMLDRDPSKQEFNAGVGKSVAQDQRREIFDKYDLLEMHLEEAHNAVEETDGGLLQLNLAIMNLVGTVYADRHRNGFELDDTDYSVVADFIAAQRRVEQISALATGLMTAYHTVIRDNKDPKLIEKFVNEASKGLPTTGTATTDDAKAYVESLKKDLSGTKERYYGFVKELYGEELVSSYKSGIDEKVDKTSALMQTPMGSKQASAAPAGPGPGAAAGAGGAGAGNGQLDTLKKGVAAAQAGNVGGVVNAAADLLPIDGRAKTAIHGVVALAQGDFKGAINAATSLVPDGPIKKGLSILTSFL